MLYYVYDLNSGIILRTGMAGSEEACRAQAGRNEKVGIGPADELTQRVDIKTEQLVPREEPPARNPQVEAGATIQSLERRQARAVREALLELLPEGHALKSRLQTIDDGITAERGKL